MCISRSLTPACGTTVRVEVATVSSHIRVLAFSLFPVLKVKERLFDTGKGCVLFHSHSFISIREERCADTRGVSVPRTVACRSTAPSPPMKAHGSRCGKLRRKEHGESDDNSHEPENGEYGEKSVLSCLSRSVVLVVLIEHIFYSGRAAPFF